MGRPARSSLAIYLQAVREARPLERNEEVEIATRAHRGDLAMREQLLRANLAFVVRTARRYVHLGLPLEDLIGEGNLGLLRAAEHFDPACGARFATYASRWIRQTILTALAEHRHTSASGASPVAHECVLGRTDRPCSDRDLGHQLNAALSKLPTREERVLRLAFGLDADAPPTLSGVARLLRVSPQRLTDLRDRALSHLRRLPETQACLRWRS